jgi:hypothetical protein
LIDQSCQAKGRQGKKKKSGVPQNPPQPTTKDQRSKIHAIITMVQQNEIGQAKNLNIVLLKNKLSLFVAKFVRIFIIFAEPPRSKRLGSLPPRSPSCRVRRDGPPRSIASRPIDNIACFS